MLYEIRVNMSENIQFILEKSKIILKESIIYENKIIEENILDIITNIKQLESQLDKNNILKKEKKLDKNQLEKLEIEKIKRKVPLWIEKRSQANYKILKAFMDLSNNGNHSVNVNSLERYVNFNDTKKFISHYNQLKSISAKNHGKVFEENNQQISLWEPVEEFIKDQFKNMKFY